MFVMSYIGCVISWMQLLKWDNYNGVKSYRVDVTLCRVHKMTYIKWVWCHTYSYSETIHGVVVITQIWWMPLQIQCEWCHEHRACDLINNLVWCHKMLTWYFTQCIWYYKESGWDVIHIKGVISLKKWVWWHIQCCDVIYNGCDSSYIADEISTILLVWYHQYSGCDDTDTVDTMSI